MAALTVKIKLFGAGDRVTDEDLIDRMKEYLVTAHSLPCSVNN
jgi:hypothetical protein